MRALLAVLLLLAGRDGLGDVPPQRIEWPAESLPIVVNLRSGVYFWPGCPNYTQIAPQRQERYRTPAEAEAAGYRAAKNCPAPAPPQETPPYGNPAPR